MNTSASKANRENLTHVKEGRWELLFTAERVRNGVIAPKRHIQEGEVYRMTVSLGYASLADAHRIVEMEGFKNVRILSATRVEPIEGEVNHYGFDE